MNPKFLNLDDLENTESDITIRHDGVDHKMRTLDVNMFIAQQKRAAKHEKAVAANKADEDVDMADVVELIRDAVIEFFPTMPAGEIPTNKLFVIFAWLNELTAKISEIASEGVVDADPSTAGNVETAAS